MGEFKDTYSNFFIRNRRYWDYNTEQTEEMFKRIYTAECITKMVDMIEEDKPVVLAISYILDDYYKGEKLDEQFKRVCHAWIKLILNDFGYVKTYSRNIINGKYFSSGYCYIEGCAPRKSLSYGYEIRNIEH